MASEVYVAGKRIRLDPQKARGQGGEAEIYEIEPDKVVKVFKPPNHPDYADDPHEQEGARRRIEVHQTKLKEFPQGLPGHVVTPIELATNRNGDRVVGYTMKFLKGAELLYRFSELARHQAGLKNEQVQQILLDLHTTVAETHKVGVVFGDFNDLNVLVLGDSAYIIDADSAQFGRYLCNVFQVPFVDPLLCDPKQNSPSLARPYGINSDWFSFAVMLFKSFLCVHPYGGMYKPKDKSKRVPHTARPLKGISVFHPEVGYPKKQAIPFGVLPDDLLHYLHEMFDKQKRGKFPRELIEEMRWTVCDTCGTEHARGTCPECKQAAPAAVREVVEVRGTVTASRIFQTHGVILYATYQGRELRWLYHENDTFRREDQSTILQGKLDQHMRYRIQGKATLLAKSGKLVFLDPGKQPAQQNVDMVGILPIFDANDKHTFWVQNGMLVRDGKFGVPERIGDVLQEQTLFWVGPKFGFGFYRAGQLCRYFVFSSEHQQLNDNVKLPSLKGQLIDVTCTFTENRCWFFVSTQLGGKRTNTCYLLKDDGTVLAETLVDADQQQSWLSSLRGKCAVGNFLLATTNEGVVRIEQNGNALSVVKRFPDTEPFVHEGCQLFPGQQGLYVVNGKEIHLLKIK
jgi:H/ACA ribonucleoprotein complex subunit 3